MKRNPAWTEAELILALDVYMDLPSGAISSKNLRVIALSEQLNKLHAAEMLDPVTYRNPNGAALKLHNFARFDPNSSSRGMTNGGRLEEVIWNRYSTNRAGLRADAARIQASLS